MRNLKFFMLETARGRCSAQLLNVCSVKDAVRGASPGLSREPGSLLTPTAILSVASGNHRPAIGSAIRGIVCNTLAWLYITMRAIWQLLLLLLLFPEEEKEGKKKLWFSPSSICDFHLCCYYDWGMQSLRVVLAAPHDSLARFDIVYYVRSFSDLMIYSKREQDVCV